MNNDRLVYDVADLRETIPHPEDRRYTIMVRGDHIRVVYDDDVSLARTDNTAVDGLFARGYRLSGVNWASQTLVFTHPEGSR